VPLEPNRGPEPEPEHKPDEADRAQARLVLLRLLPLALALFLAVVALGFLPPLIAERWPRLGRGAALGVWLVFPVLAIVMVGNVVRRLARARGRDGKGSGRPGPGGAGGPPP
jgi:hypothetical protein